MTQTLATQSDAVHLERTLELADRGRGSTSPNPLVGAVVVKHGRSIGEGFHAGPGTLHAEPRALASAVEDPEGATLYVSLEPCAHHGRTPPCTDAILAAGIARVVVASDDPTPKASGRGPELLRAARAPATHAGSRARRVGPRSTGCARRSTRSRSASAPRWPTTRS
jgi:pyrimidine deaminase RibD-like protein